MVTPLGITICKPIPPMVVLTGSWVDLSEGEQVVIVSIPLLGSSHRKLIEIRDRLNYPNLRLVLQRLISEFRVPEVN